MADIRFPKFDSPKFFVIRTDFLKETLSGAFKKNNITGHYREICVIGVAKIVMIWIFDRNFQISNPINLKSSQLIAIFTVLLRMLLLYLNNR